MFNGLGNMAALLKQASEVKGRVRALEESLQRVRVTAEVGGGMVCVEANGRREILACRIDPKLISGGDRELLEDLIVSAVNQALEKAQAAAAEEISKLAGNLNFPGLGEALSRFGLGGGAKT